MLENLNYEIVKARSGEYVPCIEGIYLHSIYNPKKEAHEFIQKYKVSLAKKNKALVLGLGLGHHIHELIDFMKQNHSEFQVVVLEPFSNLIKDYRALCSGTNRSIEFDIIHNQDVEELYTDQTFINFLYQKPVVIGLPTELQLHHKYFTQFLSYETPATVGNLRQIVDPEIVKVLENFAANESFENVVRALTTKKVLNKNEYILIAAQALIEQATSLKGDTL